MHPCDPHRVLVLVGGFVGEQLFELLDGLVPHSHELGHVLAGSHRSVVVIDSKPVLATVDVLHPQRGHGMDFRRDPVVVALDRSIPPVPEQVLPIKEARLLELVVYAILVLDTGRGPSPVLVHGSEPVGKEPVEAALEEVLVEGFSLECASAGVEHLDEAHSRRRREHEVDESDAASSPAEEP